MREMEGVLILSAKRVFFGEKSTFEYLVCQRAESIVWRGVAPIGRLRETDRSAQCGAKKVRTKNERFEMADH